MRGSPAWLALCLLLATAVHAAAPAEPEAAVLLERAESWQLRGRDDLAREELERLFRLAPDQPEGLAALARIQLRAGQEAEAAKTYARLRAAHPGHPAVAQVAALLKVYGPDRQRYRQAQQLARAGQAEQALKVWLAIFPGPIPDDELALEFAQVRGSTAGGWEEARIMLASLAARHPKDPRYALAYASHLSTRKPVPAEALKSLRELSDVPAVSKLAREAWRRAVLRMDADEASVAALKEYVAANPDDATVREKLDGVTKAVERQRAAQADPVQRAKREAEALLEAGKLDEAQARLEEAIARRPGDAEAIGALGIVRMKQERHGEAAALFAKAGQLDAPGRAKWDGLARTATYWDLVKQAGKAREAGRIDVAEARLLEARALDPREPYGATELARVRVAQGRAEEAERLYREALGLAPGNAAAVEGLASLLLRADRDGEVDALLAGLAPSQRAEVDGAVNALRADRLRERAKRLAGRSRDAEAVTALEQAVALDPANPWVRFDLARLLAARGEAERGRAVFDGPMQRRPVDAEMVYALALFLSGADRESEALASLERVPVAERTAGMTRLQRRLWVTVQGQRAEALAKAGRSDDARRVLASARAAAGSDPELATTVANACLRTGDVEGARSVLEVLASAGTRSREQEEAIAGLRLSLAMREAGDLRELRRWDEAARAYRAILATNPGEKEAQLALADSLFELGDFAAAQSLVETALATDPGEPRALELAARLAQREGRVDRAIAYRRQAFAAEMSRRTPESAGRLSVISRTPDAAALSVDPAPPEASAAARDYPGRYRPLAELLDQEPSWLSSALDWRYRSGTAGKSRIGAQELPLEWKQGWSPAGRWFFRADLARVDAGALDLADAAEASTFGSVLLCQPGCGQGSLSQVEKGVAFGAGLERDGVRVDLGTSPVGYPVVNLLGGLLVKGELGPLSYSIDASRRAVTSSLLSWAGTTDPNTGRTWGGVVATGVRLGFSRDTGGDYGAWGSLGMHRLGGRNVQDNDRMQLMAGGYRRLVNEEDRQLGLGITGMWWRHSENAGEFTFGHGGYYSPRTYGSLALPLTYAVRTERSSFALRASVSVAWSESKRAAYFPTDPGLQAQALALAPSNGIDPYYEGGSNGRSYGRALGGAYEYQLLPGLFAGARLELERSTNYTPNRFLLYIRLVPDRPSARPVPVPPEPVLPSSQF